MDWPRSALLLVSSSSRTGPVEGFLSLAREVRRRGVEARFAGDTVRPGENLDEHLALAGVPSETGLRLSRKVRPGDVLHDARLLTRWAREGRYDLLQAGFAHEHHLCLWAAARARRTDLRVVRAAQRRRDVEPGLAGQRLWALRRSDGVIVHAEAYRRRLLESGLEPERVAAIPASVDAEWFTPGSAAHLRRQWGVPEDAPLAGIVARMKPERAHRSLLRAFARALESCRSAWLVVVGRGEDEPALRALARQLSPRIVFGGYLRGPGLADAYRALDVAVWLREGNDGGCRGVLEAMASGKPVIAGSEGASGELVRDGQDGIVVPPEDEQAIAAALVSLLGDPDRARTLGESARKRAAGFAPAAAAEATLAFWQTLRGLEPRSQRLIQIK